MNDIDKFLNENFSKLEKKMEAKKNKTISKITANLNMNVSNIHHKKEIKFNFDNTLGSEIYTSINFASNSLGGTNISNKEDKIPPIAKTLKELFPSDKVFENEYNDKLFLLDSFISK